MPILFETQGPIQDWEQDPNLVCGQDPKSDGAYYLNMHEYLDYNLYVDLALDPILT